MTTKALVKNLNEGRLGYPVFQKGQARIQDQIPAVHTRAHLDKAIGAFGEVGTRAGVLK
jgi:glycine C-acetyltransferase